MSKITPMNRREIVEQASKAFKVLEGLGALCAELGAVDNLDRAVADAEARLAKAKKAEADYADQAAKVRKQQEAKAEKIVQEATAAAARITKNAEDALADANTRSANILNATNEKAAAKMLELEGKATEVSGQIDAGWAKLASLNATLDAKTKELRELDERLAKARSAAAALLSA